MCGRYAFFQQPSVVRRQLQEAHMPCDDAPDDDSVRQSYNFCPGYFGLVYRANVPDYGAGPSRGHEAREHDEAEDSHSQGHEKAADSVDEDEQGHGDKRILQAMKWGLVPSWTKRNPDYGTIMRTINCRDDSLADNRGMWTNMKKRKRCIVLCQGFYEWLKKNNGKEKIPHYVKRKDGQLMCFAGLWDCVKYDGSDEKNYTYTVITTDSNKQLKFLHDRMPVLFDPGSEEIRTWLDPERYEWSKELQSLLKPYKGELECYPVNKDVGKVGNNSATFIVPIDSKENKSNIANFFGNQKKGSPTKTRTASERHPSADEPPTATVKKQDGEERQDPADDADHKGPNPSSTSSVKREHDKTLEESSTDGSPNKRKVQRLSTPEKAPSRTAVGRKTRSATSNGSMPSKSSPAKASQGSQKITSFFAKQ